MSYYSQDIINELNQEGITVFLEILKKKEYDESKGMLTTYLYPFIKGGMYRYMESSLGCCSVDKEDMTLIRKIQQAYHIGVKSEEELSTENNISISDVQRMIGYNTHFFSYGDATGQDFDGDPFEFLMVDRLSVPADRIAYCKICIELLRELFNALPRKEKTILAKSYGAFGYKKAKLIDIALEQIMKEDAVMKARKRAIKRLRANYGGSRLQLWMWAYRAVMQEAKK